jgi:hypothetical protein
VAIAVTAANLRPAFASVGPVLDDLRIDVGLGGTGESVLSSVPVLCLGLAAPPRRPNGLRAEACGPDAMRRTASTTPWNDSRVVVALAPPDG